MGKTIMITGAGSGIGKGAAIGLAKAGHEVIAAVENQPQITGLIESSQKAGVELEILKMDITNPDDRERMKRYDYDIFVANATVNEVGPIRDAIMSACRNLFDVNVVNMVNIASLARAL